MNSGGTDTLGGITIEHKGKPGVLVASGYVWNPDAGSRLDLPFRDSAASTTSHLYGPGVTLGTVGLEKFSGKLLLRNTSSVSVVVNASIQRGKKVRVLPPVTLPARGTAIANIPPDAVPDGAESLGLTISSSGDPGAVLAYWVALDGTGSSKMTSPLVETAAHSSGNGMVAWSIDGDARPVLYLQNTDDKMEARYHVYARFRTGDYTWGLVTLGPGETKAFDVRRARDNKVSDERGKLIPQDVTGGQIGFQKWGDGPDAVSQLTTASAAEVTPSFSIPTDCSCGVMDKTIILNSPLLPDLGGWGDHNWVGNAGDNWFFVVSQSDMGCDGWSPSYQIPLASVEWSSSDSSVVEVSQGQATIKGVGVATVRAFLSTSRYEAYCQPVLSQDDCIPLKWPRIGWDCEDCTCVEEPMQAPDSGDVTGKPTVSLNSGLNFAFVGDDPTVVSQNLFGAVGAPSGGTYSWTASDSRFSFDHSNASLVHLIATFPSGTLEDKSLTVKYTFNNQSAITVLPITARIFSSLIQHSTFLTEFNGPNTWGYVRNVLYDIYTSPSNQLVAPGFSGISTVEQVSQAGGNATITPHTQSGATDQNSEFADELSLLSNAQIPADLSIVDSQNITVGGLCIRNNTLTFSATDVIVSSNGAACK